MPRSAPQHRRHETVPTVARLTRSARRRQLLAQAVLVFAERGYHNTTTELVAEVAGVSEAIMSKHFEDNVALFCAVLDEVRSATVERWRTATATLSDPLAKLHAVAEMYLGAARSDASEIRLLHRVLAECDSEVIAGPLRSFFLDCETFLVGIFAEGQQAGVFRRSPDPRVLAWELLHSGLGLAATRPVGIIQHHKNESLAHTIECLLHGMLKTDV